MMRFMRCWALGGDEGRGAGESMRRVVNVGQTNCLGVGYGQTRSLATAGADIFRGGRWIWHMWPMVGQLAACDVLPRPLTRGIIQLYCPPRLQSSQTLPGPLRFRFMPGEEILPVFSCGGN